jgi:UDP-2-acetamido-3-amino-2,3-dideoxy-glucuronate N-acetyltransferase
VSRDHVADRVPYCHETAIVESPNIGDRARIGAFVHILPGAFIGHDASVNDHVFIDNGVTIGDRVTVKSGVQLWDGLVVEDDVFIGPSAAFVNELSPPSEEGDEKFSRTTLRRGCSIGANATILGGVTVGLEAMVDAGAVVAKDVPPFAVVVGNPARIVRYTSSSSPAAPTATAPGGVGEDQELAGGARLLRLPAIEDLRGGLTFAEVGAGLPFVPQRIFAVYSVPTSEVRGEHAHRTLHQLLLCVAGRCHVIVDDGLGSRMEVVLDRPNLALHIPPLVWSTQYNHSPDAVMVVLASERYDSGEYIRDYDEFFRLRGAGGPE